MLGAPTSSRTTSKGPCAGEARRAPRRSAPNAATAVPQVGVAHRGRDVAPRRHRELDAGGADAPGRAVHEHPLAHRQPHWVNSASCAVVNTSGKPPAAAQEMPSGTGMAVRSCTTASSACPPPPTTAMTRSPCRTARRRAPRRPPRRPARGRACRRARPAARVEPVALQHVGAVEAGGAHGDEQLARAGEGRDARATRASRRRWSPRARAEPVLRRGGWRRRSHGAERDLADVQHLCAAPRSSCRRRSRSPCGSGCGRRRGRRVAAPTSECGPWRPTARRSNAGATRPRLATRTW